MCRLPAGWIIGRRWEAGGYAFEALRESDIEAVRQWRNEQMDVLRQQRPLPADHQQRWFRGSVLPTHEGVDPPFLLWSMLDRDKAVAYGGLTNVDWDSLRAEISFLADTERARSAAYAELFDAFLTWIVGVAFDELSLHRLFTETYAFRTEQLELLERHGFVVEGRLREHVRKDGQFLDSVIHARLSDSRSAP